MLEPVLITIWAQARLQPVLSSQQGHVVLAGQQDPDASWFFAVGHVRLEDLEFVADDGNLEAEYLGGRRNGPLLVFLVVAGLAGVFDVPLFAIRELLLGPGDDSVLLAEGDEIIRVHVVEVCSNLLPNPEVLILAAKEMGRDRPKEAVAIAKGTKDIARPGPPLVVASELLLDAAKAEREP